MTHKEAIECLEYWAYTRGYCIEFSCNGDDSVDKDAKIISINTTRSLEIQLHTLLHECGHILVYGSDEVWNISEVTDDYGEKSNIYRRNYWR